MDQIFTVINGEVLPAIVHTENKSKFLDAGWKSTHEAAEKMLRPEKKSKKEAE